MKIEKFYRYENNELVNLKAYLPEENPQILFDESRPCVLICPGGGYNNVSPRESEPIALKFLSAGIVSFVLTYSVAPYAKNNAPLTDAFWAMNLIRDNCNTFKINPEKIIVCGFSAGGHLAASLTVFHNREDLLKLAQVSNKNVKPNASILCYPVITSDTDSIHIGSFTNLFGNDSTNSEILDTLSPEKHIHNDVCPCFIVHTADDKSVSVNNSLKFAMGLSKFKIPYELHVFESGLHGLSLAQRNTAPSPEMINPNFAKWADMAIDWIFRFF